MSEDNTPGPAITRSNFRRLGGTGAFLLAVLFIAGTIGNIGGSLSELTSLCLLLGFLLAFAPQVATGAVESGAAGPRGFLRRLTNNKKLRLYSSLALLYGASAVLVLTRNRAAGMLGLAVLVFGLDLIARRVGEILLELPPLLLAVILFSLYLVLLDYVPPLWRLLNGASLLLSNGVGQMLGRQLNLAASYSGLHIVALFALYFLGALVFARRKKPSAVIGLFASLLVVYILYMMAWSLISGSSLPRRLQLAQPLVSAYYYWLLLFALLLIPTYLMLASVSFKEVRLVPGSVDLKRVVPAALLLLLALPLLVIQPSGSVTSRKVVLFDTGRLDWSVPDYGRLGLKNTGMFGLLPEYLNERGYPASRERELTPQALGGAGTLVLINLDRKLNEREKAAVWKFVRDGGSLLVLGDHTGREIIREPYNDLLNTVGIAFAFDSSIPVTDRWQGGGFELKPHPIFTGIGQDELQINIGATLTASGPARPVLVGRYGFSDKGNALAVRNGFLGDMKYTGDERLGDLVLAADARYGKGKVLAFGDTTSFQNGALPQSHRFVDNVFAWLSSSGGAWYPYNVIIAVMLLAGSLALLFAGAKSTASLMGFVVLLALALLVSSAASAHGAPDNGRLSSGPAIIDASHLEQVSMEPFKDGSLDGITANLMRSGYIPLLMKDFSASAVENARMLVIVAPAKPFSTAEIKAIKAFAQRGGLLIVTSGYEESDGSSPLLAEFGLSVGDTPLGRVSTDSPFGPKGVDLWNAWPVAADAGVRMDVLARKWGYPVIVFSRYGKGGVLVAGDSSFVLNKNLEEQDTVNESNILFLKECIGSFKEGRIGQ